MTLTSLRARHDLPVPLSTPRRARPECDLLEAQLAAIDAWNAQRRLDEVGQQSGSTTLSREMRLDLARRTDVVRRQHAAIVERTEQQLRESVHLLRGSLPVRAVVAHRDAWFRDKVADALGKSGVDVVALLDNGADAVGVVVAEQPDLLLVQDKLPMVLGVDVLRQAARFSPDTVSAAQASHDSELAALLEAGSRAAFNRRATPTEVAAELCQLVQA